MYGDKFTTMRFYLSPVYGSLEESIKSFKSNIVRETCHQYSSSYFLSFIQRFYISQDSYASEAMTNKITVFIRLSYSFLKMIDPFVHCRIVCIRHSRSDNCNILFFQFSFQPAFPVMV